MAKKLKGYTTFDIVLIVVFSLLALIMIYPIWYVIVCSFNEGTDYIAGGIYLLPRKWTGYNYLVVFSNAKLWNAYLVTISRTILGTVIALSFTTIVSYAMSRKELPFKKVIYLINIFTMFFSGGLIPFFLIIKMIGMYDTYALYLIPCMYSVYHMIILSSYFSALPEELREAAVLDGAGEWRILFTVVIPLSTPVLATVGMWIAIGHWNSFFDSMVYTQKESLMTLQHYLNRVINSTNIDAGGITLPESVVESMTAEVITFASIVVSILPVMFIFPFVSKYFEKGIMVGSVKG
ncbi:MAG: carbohydrate ABC transporter permease [Clostridia bacterium]|nr:carbohydrate ABC transporter permease [Clostridia bacterium]